MYALTIIPFLFVLSTESRASQPSSPACREEEDLLGYGHKQCKLQWSRSAPCSILPDDAQYLPPGGHDSGVQSSYVSAAGFSETPPSRKRSGNRSPSESSRHLAASCGDWSPWLTGSYFEQLGSKGTVKFMRTLEIRFALRHTRGSEYCNAQPDIAY